MKKRILLICAVCASVLLSAASSGLAALAVHYTFDNTYSDQAIAVPDGSIATDILQGAGFDNLAKIGSHALRTEGAADPNQNKVRWADGEIWLDGKTAVTMSFWLQPDVGDGDDYFFGTGSSNNDYWCFRKDSSTEVDFYLRTSTASAQLYSYAVTELFKSSQWTHFAFTWSSGNTPKLYLWGKEVVWTVNPGTLGGTADARDYIGIAEGRTTSSSAFWDGRIDDVGLWDEVLSAGKIAVIHGLGEFEEQNLGDSDIDGMLAAFNAGQDYATDQNQWYYIGDGSLGGTTGDIGGTVAGGDAFIVLDDSGNGMILGLITACDAANLDGTGVVNMGDYAVLAAEWMSSTPPLEADIDGNGTTEWLDLAQIAEYWLVSCN